MNNVSNPVTSYVAALIGQYRTPLAIVGASAIDGEGVSEALLTAAQVYSAMIQHADRTVVLADNTKFANRSLQIILNWDADKTIVTDRAPEQSLRDEIEGKGAQILIAKRG